MFFYSYFDNLGDNGKHAKFVKVLVFHFLGSIQSFIYKLSFQYY